MKAIACPVRHQVETEDNWLKMSSDKFSVLLPTYNERQNLPLIVFHLVEMFEKEYACLY